MNANGALRFAWTWLSLLALFLGTDAPPPPKKGVDEWDGDVLK